MPQITEIKAMFPQIQLEVTYSYGEYMGKSYGIMVVDKLVVPKEYRKHGIGTQVMNQICGNADSLGVFLMLSPSISLGATSLARLKRFYKRFGFIGNTGKHKIYTFPNYLMYRKPRGVY